MLHLESRAGLLQVFYELLVLQYNVSGMVRLSRITFNSSYSENTSQIINEIYTSLAV